MLAEVSLAKGIAQIESLLAEVQAAISKRSGLKEYQVPEPPLGITQEKETPVPETEGSTPERRARKVLPHAKLAWQRRCRCCWHRLKNPEAMHFWCCFARDC
jgi:hypothetical protein